jgi:hypothetical protein
VPQRGWLLDDAQLAGVRGDVLAHLDHVVDVGLRVGPPRYRQPDQVHRRRLLGAVGVAAEHHRADLAAADAAFQVEGDRERLPGRLERGDVRQQRPRVDVDGVAADGQDYRYPGRVEGLAQVLGRADAVAQVVLVDRFAQALGDPSMSRPAIPP